MDLEDAIRGRRTHKAYGSEPVDRATLEELFELARWAPNHHLTNPWRFRVLGPQALARLKDAAGPEAAAQARPRADPDRRLGRAVRGGPGAGRGGPPRRRRRGVHRPARRARARPRGLLAHARGVRTDAGRAALGVPDDERVIGLLHLGPPRQERDAPERAPTGDVVKYLD